MKVMQLCYGLNIGGVQRVAVNLSNSLANNGIHVVFCYRIDGDLKNVLSDKIIKIRYDCNKPNLKDIFIKPYLISRLIKIVKSEQIDLIHSYDIVSWAIGSIVAKILNIPLIRTQPNFITKYEKLNTRTLKILPFEKWTTIFHSIWEATTEDLVRAGINRNKIITISNVLPNYEIINVDSIYQEYGLDRNKKIIVTIGRMVEGKGWEKIPLIAKNVIKNNKDIIFLLVGDGPIRLNLEEKIKELGLKEYFIFTGYRTDVDRILSQSYIGLFPTDSHAGMVECVKYIPLVAGNGLTQKEYIKDGLTGFLCNDLDQYVRNINLLLSNCELYNKMKIESNKFFYKKLNLENGISKFINMYEKTLEIHEGNLIT